MINITKEAAKVIQQQISKEENKGFKLRIAVMKNKDDSLHYAIGFDDNHTNNDKIHKW